MNLGRHLASLRRAINGDGKSRTTGDNAGTCALEGETEDGDFLVRASEQSTGLPFLQPLQAPDTQIGQERGVPQ